MFLLFICIIIILSGGRGGEGVSAVQMVEGRGMGGVQVLSVSHKKLTTFSSSLSLSTSNIVQAKHHNNSSSSNSSNSSDVVVVIA